MKTLWFYLLPLPLMAVSLFIGPSDAVTWRDVLVWAWQETAALGGAGHPTPW
jgi:hypothetical protein